MSIKLLVGVLIVGLGVSVPNVHSLDCVTCTSATNPACATLSGNLQNVTCTEGADACYTYLDGEVTIRGCELPTPIPSEYFSCSGDNCNANIYPDNRLTCHKCSGPECLTSNDLSAPVPCEKYRTDDVCITHYDNDVATRGCLSEYDNLVTACQDETQCGKCATNGCNGKTIEEEQCIVCDSQVDGNCVSNLNATMQQVCPMSAAGMGCYRFDDGGGMVIRGCLSSLHPGEVNECRREAQFCKTCTGDNCNAKVSFETCRVCDSTTTVNCIRSPSSVATQTCRNYLDSCFVHVENNIVTRGCVSDQPAAIQTECASSSSDLCETCVASSGNCNNKIIDSEFCMECENCRTNLNHTTRIQCNLGVRQLGCYLFDDGGDIIKRGCINNDLHPGEVSMCRQQGQFCKTCYGNDCNAKETFQRCRSCNSATDVNCIRSGGSANEITCRDYMDTCYVHVRDDIVTRGCVAQPSTPTAVQTECRRTNSDFCETCTGNNCNSALVDGEFCLTCDSMVNPDCRDTLNHTMRQQCNLGVRKLGCYRYDDGGEIIKRGCLSHLIPEEISFCRNQGQFCKTCIGDDCNAKIDFQQCRACNSTQGVECIRSATTVSTRTCRNYLDECFTHVDNNVITRGCLQENPNLTSDCRNGDICESCDSRGNCNDKIVNGEFCITCSSETDPNCVDNLNHTMRTQCSLTVAGMGCYMYDDGGSIIKRGCLSDLIPYEVSMCRQEGQFCKTCQGNDCNNQLRFRQCLTCDSSTNPDCFTPNENVPSSVCRSYTDTCVTHLENDRARRGCSSNRNDLVLSCQNDPSLCNTCTGSNCNSADIEPEFCITCDSENDPNCRTNPNMAMATQCGTSARLNKVGCYRFDDSGDIVKRGCLEELVAGEIQMCRQQGAYCKTCTGDNCNFKATFQTCYRCNSETNSTCITLNEPPPTTTCRSYTDRCRSITLIGGRTERGCASELTLTGTTLSEDCSGANCNGAVFPPNRISCHQCSGSQCSGDLSSNTAFAEVCRNYEVNDQCYSFVDAAREMHRGCASDNTNDRNACTAAQERCVICDGMTCNSRPATAPSSLSCVQCSNTDAACGWGHEQGAVCSQSVVFPDVESCFTYNHGNEAVTRGCTLNSQALCSVGDDRCRTCTGNGCNNQNVVTQSCKVCRSDVIGQEQCGSDAFTGFEVQCGAVVKYADRGCYSKREDGVIVRGCAVNLSAEEVTECTDAENDQCIYCDGNNCNVDVPTASASLKSILSFGLTVCLAVLLSW